MKLPRMVRTELVISMTLAETFLLLLFAVWYGLAKDITARPPSLLELKVKDLEDKVRQLEGEIAAERRRNEDLREALKFWRGHYNIDIPKTQEEVKRFLADAGRGFPRCQENNVLVRATVSEGQMKLEVVGESPDLAQFLAASGMRTPEAGTVLADRRAIQTFLTGMSSYYSKRRSDGAKQCRFDYRLRYVTKGDYFDGRELFENYFYPARITKLGK
jgi:hypothetical protein